MKNLILFCCWLCFISSPLSSQEAFHITIVSDDANEGTRYFENSIQSEVAALMSNQYDITFNILRATEGPQSIAAVIDQAYASSTDAVIGIGLTACDQMAKRENLSKPTILTFILDNELQQIPISDNGTSGVTNLNYIQSPFDIKRDLETLYEFIPFKKLAVINAEGLSDTQFRAFFAKALDFSTADFTKVSVDENSTAASILAEIPPDAEAVYMLPISNDMAVGELSTLLSALAERSYRSFPYFLHPAWNWVLMQLMKRMEIYSVSPGE